MMKFDLIITYISVVLCCVVLCCVVLCCVVLCCIVLCFDVFCFGSLEFFQWQITANLDKLGDEHESGEKPASPRTKSPRTPRGTVVVTFDIPPEVEATQHEQSPYGSSEPSGSPSPAPA